MPVRPVIYKSASRTVPAVDVSPWASGGSFGHNRLILSNGEYVVAPKRYVYSAQALEHLNVVEQMATISDDFAFPLIVVFYVLESTHYLRPELGQFAFDRNGEIQRTGWSHSSCFPSRRSKDAAVADVTEWLRRQAKASGVRFRLCVGGIHEGTIKSMFAAAHVAEAQRYAETACVVG